MKSAPNNRVAAGSLEIFMLTRRLLAAAEHERYTACTLGDGNGLDLLS